MYGCITKAAIQSDSIRISRTVSCKVMVSLVNGQLQMTPCFCFQQRMTLMMLFAAF